MVDGLSGRGAAKRFGVHRNTITKMVSFSVPPGDDHHFLSRKPEALFGGVEFGPILVQLIAAVLRDK